MSDAAPHEASLQYRPIADGFVVAPQIRPDQVPAIADAGFTTIICNRPDGEADDQPDFAGVRAAAEKLGLATRFIPVSNQVGITAEAVADTQKALSEIDGPIFAYCRSGARCAKLYEIATAT